MKHIVFKILFLASLIVGSLNAQLVLEDFESYIDTSSLQTDVFTFGSAAQAGKPSLVVGLGENGTNAACFNLTWETGNNANLSFINLSPNTQDLSFYSEISAFIFIEAYPVTGGFTEMSTPTVVKLAIEGNDGTIWQTRSVKAEKPPVDSSYKLRFNLSQIDMERIDGKGNFNTTIADVKNIRLRFENAKKAGFRQDAYIDSIVAAQ